MSGFNSKHSEVSEEKEEATGRTPGTLFQTMRPKLDTPGQQSDENRAKQKRNIRPATSPG